MFPPSPILPAHGTLMSAGSSVTFACTACVAAQTASAPFRVFESMTAVLRRRRRMPGDHAGPVQAGAHVAAAAYALAAQTSAAALQQGTTLSAHTVRSREGGLYVPGISV